MYNWLERTSLLLGEEGIAKLQAARILVLGLGGVGSYVVEGLARSGVGSLVLVDPDQVVPSNINRQLPALRSTVGRSKAQVLQERVAQINPEAETTVREVCYTAELAERFFAQPYDYVVDAIDDVPAKVSLALECCRREQRLIASMGAGNRLEAHSFRISDVSQTSGDPLARKYRRLLKEAGLVSGVKVLYSPQPGVIPRGLPGGERAIGSVAFVPSVAGLLIAGEVVRDITNCNKRT